MRGEESHAHIQFLFDGQLETKGGMSVKGEILITLPSTTIHQSSLEVCWEASCIVYILVMVGIFFFFVLGNSTGSSPPPLLLLPQNQPGAHQWKMEILFLGRMIFGFSLFRFRWARPTKDTTAAALGETPTTINNPSWVGSS